MTSLIGELAVAHRAAHEHPESADPPLVDVLKEAEGLAGESAIIVATALDAPGEGFDAVAERLARKRDLCIVLVTDRFETDPVAGAYPYRTQDGDAGWLRVGRNAKAPAADARLARLQRLGVNFLQLDAALDVESMMSTLEQLHG
jgi:hypothetical protein